MPCRINIVSRIIPTVAIQILTLRTGRKHFMFTARLCNLDYSLHKYRGSDSRTGRKHIVFTARLCNLACHYLSYHQNFRINCYNNRKDNNLRPQALNILVWLYCLKPCFFFSHFSISSISSLNSLMQSFIVSNLFSL